MNPCFPFTFTLPLVAAALALCVGAYSLYKTLKRRCNQSVKLPVHMEKILPSVSGSIESPESVLTFNLQEWKTRRQARDKSPESVLTFNLKEWETRRQARDKSPEGVLSFNLKEWETRRQARDKSSESVLTFNLEEWETRTRTEVCFTDKVTLTLGDNLHFLSNNRII